MKWLAALLAAAVVTVVVAFVVAVGSTRDSVPGALRDCVLDGQAGIVRGPAELGGRIRTDIGAGELRERTRTKLGQDTAVVLEGSNYRILVLAARKSPPLDGDLAQRVFDRAPAYALVAKEVDPSQGVLAGCVRLVAAR